MLENILPQFEVQLPRVSQALATYRDTYSVLSPYITVRLFVCFGYTYILFVAKL